MNQTYLKQQLELAIKTDRTVIIDYVSIKMKITKDRLIDPIELKTRKDGLPAVIAHCFLRNELREFMFTGIQSIELTDKSNYGKSKELMDDRGDDSAKYEGEIK